MKAEEAWFVLAAAARLTFRRIGLLVVVNVLWWLLSLPVLTWPPATAGLYHVVRRLTNLEKSEQTTWRHFFEGFRRYWLGGWKLAVTDVALIAVLAFTLFFYFSRSNAVLRWLSIPIFWLVILWAGVQLYLFPLFIEQEDKQIHLVFKNAFILAIANPSFTFLLGFLLTMATIIAVILAGPVLFILISFLAVTQTLGLQKLLAAHRQLHNELKD